MPGRQRQTRRKVKNSDPAVLSIPELRRAFEYIEEYAMRHPNDVKAFRQEWKKVFYKEVDTKSAEEYLRHIRESKPKVLRRSKTIKGGADALAGAPLDYTTRAGIYITPGIDNGSYAHVPKYVSSGFWNPEPGISYDPVQGQPLWPKVPLGMGSNLVKGGSCDSGMCRIGGKAPTDVGAIKPVSTGGNRKSRKLRKGGASLQTAVEQIGMRLFGSSSPPSALQSVEAKFAGRNVDPSPEASDMGQRALNRL
jgi:hypothetical protein